MDHPVHSTAGPKLPAWLLDTGASGVTLVVGAWLIANREHPAGALWLALALSAAALLRRRRAPLAVLGVVLAAMVSLNAGAVTILPALIALLSVAIYRERMALVAATVVTAATVAATGPLHGTADGASDIATRVIAVGLAVAVGLYLRARADYVGGLRERSERLARERELLANQAVAEERVRIARELHDVVAHNVSLMVVQAQALAVTGADPPGLERLAGLGREALSEMHRMLDVLRLENGDAPERAPQPGMDDLDALVARTGEAGLDAKLTVVGEPRELPAGVELSAYRIVQEALTNVVRHAAARHVDVELAYSPEALLVTVTDDGRGPQTASTAGGGHGLVGMRERVALFGGGMQAGARGDAHGYRVRVALPTR